MKSLASLSLALLALVAPLGASARAQTSATASLASSATVVAPISVSVTAPLDFGKLTASQTKTIANDDPTSGRFIATADPNVSFYITVTPPAALSDGASHTLPLSSFVLTFTGGSDHAGGSVISMTSSSFSGLSTVYFRLGGTVTASAGQAGGAYAANIAITVNY